MKLSQTSQYNKDIKKQIKRGKDFRKLVAVVEILLSGNELPEKNNDHALRGHWIGRRDCHIGPDWVLIYRILEDEIRLERTGTHSDLF